MFGIYLLLKYSLKKAKIVDRVWAKIITLIPSDTGLE